jgi:hypothetical protein
MKKRKNEKTKKPCLQRRSPGCGAGFDEVNVIPELDNQGGSFFQYHVIALFEQSQKRSNS